MGIKEMALRIQEFTERYLLDEEACATIIGADIVVCTKNAPAYFVTGVRFDASTPKTFLTTVADIINRMVFALGPEEASAIVKSTMSKAYAPRVRRGVSSLSLQGCDKNIEHYKPVKYSP
jgi:hypothetical protein